MNKIVILLQLFILNFITITRLYPKSIDLDQIAEIVTKQSDKHKSHAGNLKVNYRVSELKTKQQAIIGYLVQMNKPGFMVFDQEKVICYSLKRHLDKNDLLFKWCFPNSDIRIGKTQMIQANLSFSTQSSLFRQWPSPKSTYTGGWINTTWHQDVPYNLFCPMDPVEVKKSLAGCIAISMAQIINFHQDVGPLEFSERDSYITETRHIRVDADYEKLDFLSFEQLNSMLNAIKVKYKNNIPLDSLEIAALNFACGILVNMDYRANLSSVSGLSPAVFIGRMGYEQADLADHSCDLPHLLKQNMMNGLPVLLTLPGHSVVVDGYNTDGFFHINYGWGEYKPNFIQDAWFLLYDNSRTRMNFDQAIVNINPTKSEDILSFDTPKLEIIACTPKVPSKIETLKVINNGAKAITVDHIISTSLPFQLSYDGKTFSDSLGSCIILSKAGKMIFIQYTPVGTSLKYGDIFLAYNNETKFALVELTGKVQPTCGTSVQGGAVAGVWDSVHSPYNILGDIYLLSNDRLEIRPGTRIVFWGQYKFEIKGNGHLIAKGTQQDSIYFDSIDSTGWNGIHLFLSGTNDTLAYCSIQNTKSNSWGGALWIVESSPLIMNCYLCHNSAKDGGGIYLYNSNPVIKNSLICNNSAERGGGLYAEWYSRPILVNVTLAENRAKVGGGLYCYYKTSSLLKNSILWNNHSTQGKSLSVGKLDTLTFSYTTIDTTENAFDYRSGNPCIIMDSGNICKDPLFLDTTHFFLDHRSPCIDAGDPGSMYNDPVDPVNPQLAQWPGQATPRNDMGAYGGGAQLKTGITNIPHEHPVLFKLFQNYPNPFNSTSAIECSLTRKTKVQLCVYNIRGQLVMRLVDKIMEAGNYTFWINGDGLSSGIYFYELKCDHYTETLKFTLIQ